MPKAKGHNCPKCESVLLPIGGVFDAAIKAGVKALKAAEPLAHVFLCQTCKQVVWMDKAGKKSMKPLGPQRKKRKPK